MADTQQQVPPPATAEDQTAQPQDQENVPVTSGKKISLNILHLVKTTQLQFGLRHSDYQRYRKYCSRRLTRIRKSLKFMHQTGQKGASQFVKKPVEPYMVNDERYFLIVLFRCERAWAYSMQLKHDMEIQTNNSRLKHHQFRRLDKASTYAQGLERIAVRGDEHTALQATAYAYHMQGVVAVEREQWEQALTHLAKASTIYSKLGVRSGTETNQLCKEKVEEMDLRIRFCLRELRKTKGQGAEVKDHDTQELIASVLKGHEELSEKLQSLDINDTKSQPTTSGGAQEGEVEWKGQKLVVQNDKLRGILLVNAKKLADLEKDTDSIPETKLPQFEQLFGAYTEATKLIKEDTATIQKANVGKGKAKDPQEQNLAQLQEYITYLRLLASVQRAVMLADSAAITAVTDINPVPTASKKKHPDEMVRLYENVQNGMGEIEALLRGSTQDPEDAKVSTAKLVLYKALRCYWLAHSFATLQNTEKALALFDRANEHAAQAAKDIKSASRVSKADRDRLARLEKDITASRAKSRAKAFLSTLDAQSATPKSVSLTSGLNVFDSSFLADKHLTDFPPHLEAIPCKPLLFDLALNDCTFPNLEARKKPQSTKSGGWGFGFWRS